MCQTLRRRSIKSQCNQNLSGSAVSVSLLRKTEHGPVEPERGTVTRRKSIAVLQKTKVRDFVHYKAYDNPVRTETESTEPVHEQTHPSWGLPTAWNREKKTEMMCKIPKTSLYKPSAREGMLCKKIESAEGEHVGASNQARK